MPVVPGYGKQENGKFEARLSYLDSTLKNKENKHKHKPCLDIYCFSVSISVWS